MLLLSRMRIGIKTDVFFFFFFLVIPPCFDIMGDMASTNWDVHHNLIECGYVTLSLGVLGGESRHRGQVSQASFSDAHFSLSKWEKHCQLLSHDIRESHFCFPGVALCFETS